MHYELPAGDLSGFGSFGIFVTEEKRGEGRGRSPGRSKSGSAPTPDFDTFNYAVKSNQT